MPWQELAFPHLNEQELKRNYMTLCVLTRSLIAGKESAHSTALEQLKKEHETDLGRLSEELALNKQTLEKCQSELNTSREQTATLEGREQELMEKMMASQKLREETADKLSKENQQSLVEQEERLLAERTSALAFLKEEHQEEMAALRRKAEKDLESKDAESEAKVKEMEQKLAKADAELAGREEQLEEMKRRSAEIEEKLADATQVRKTQERRRQ